MDIYTPSMHALPSVKALYMLMMLPLYVTDLHNIIRSPERLLHPAHLDVSVTQTWDGPTAASMASMLTSPQGRTHSLEASQPLVMPYIHRHGGQGTVVRLAVRCLFGHARRARDHRQASSVVPCTTRHGGQGPTFRLVVWCHVPLSMEGRWSQSG